MKVRIDARKNRIAAKIMIAVLVVIVGLVIAFVLLRTVGRNRLYGRGGTGPDLSGYYAAQTQMSEETDATEPDYEDREWQDGWVRYQGKVYEYNQNILTFLMMGVDKMEEVTEAENGMAGGQSDAMFLLVLNPDKKTIEIVAINRDTIADVDIYNEEGEYVSTEKKQITLQHGYGDGKQLSCERAVSTVSRFFYNLPIHGYAAVNMAAIPDINDCIGGVELTALQDLDVKQGNFHVKQGEQITLKGWDAFWYVKYRDITVFNSAGMRLERQKQYLNAYIKKAKEQTRQDITMPVKLYNTISDYLVTDVTVDEISYLATTVLDYSFSTENIHTLEGETVAGERFEEFHADDQKLYELIIDVFYKEVELEN